MVEFNNFFFFKLMSDDSSINEIHDWNYLKKCYFLEKWPSTPKLFYGNWTTIWNF